MGWDIGLVLHYLKHGKLQFTSKLLPRDLTLKTVFLLALASGKRRGELHALENNLHQMGDNWERLVLKPRADFLGKTHFSTKGQGTFSEIVIPAIDTAKNAEPADIALCPVHTVRVYKQESDKYRSPQQKRLIISFMKGRETDISAQSVSNYLKWLVQQAYEDTAGAGQLSQRFNMKPHDLRGHCGVFEGLFENYYEGVNGCRHLGVHEHVHSILC